MGIEEIGTKIAALRKERGVKQEELASYVGVSAQAVSKWENGGAPDAELLPRIADFFGVSLDFLFGRSASECGDLRTGIFNKLTETPAGERFKTAFELCWDMEHSLFGGFGGKAPSTWDSVADNEAELGAQDQVYSSILRDDGFTRMGIANRLQYFLLVPDAKDKESAFFNGIDYPSLFADLSDKDVFNACVMLCRRENQSSFTHKLFMKNLGVDEDKAQEIIKVLRKYKLLTSTQIEMDDEMKTVYSILSNISSFVALLIFARELIDTPHVFNFNWNGRNKPYL